MRRVLALLLVLSMCIGFAACGGHPQSNRVVEVPAPEDMTLEFLQEHAESKGNHDWEGDIYLMQPYVFAVRENGEVVCIFEGAMDVLDLAYPYVGQDRIPRDDGIMVLNLYGYLLVGNSRDGWKKR